MNVQEEVLLAESRIRPYILRTPVEYSHHLSRLTGAEVWLKMEHLQITGSFKLRGATNKLLSLSDAEKGRGVITASTGNHGSAFAYIADQLQVKGTIFLPESVSPAKVEYMQLFDVDLTYIPGDPIESEKTARATAEQHNQVYVSPYNDLQIVGGQGTIGIEIIEQVPDVDAVLVPVGGGGLIAGTAGYMKETAPDIEIIGCQPANSAVMYESAKVGKVVDIPTYPTLSDGTAGGIDLDSITFDICQRYVDEYIVVSEEEIAEGLRFLLKKHYLMVEGAAALSVASLIQQKEKFAGKTVVLVLCGRKIGIETLKKVL
jgi:threonine dehydratase